MNFLAVSDVLSISGITAVVLIAFIVAMLGYLIGSIKIKGISLGTAGVFLVAIAFGFLVAIPGLKDIDFLKNFYIENDQAKAYSYFKELDTIGLILFVTSVGFIAGPTFFRDLKQNARSYVPLGIIIILSGVLVAVVFALMPGIGSDFSAGVLSGALTSTPAFSAAENALTDATQKANVALGHAIAYPFGVVGVVLFVQLVPRIMKANMSEEVMKMQSALPELRERKIVETRDIDEFGLTAFSVAVILGIFLGGITVNVNGMKFNLGTTGGPLIVALILGHVGRIGKLSLKVPDKTLKVFREFGLMLFLIGAGVRGGVSLLAQIMEGKFVPINILWGFVAGALMTIIPMFVGFFFAKKVLKLPLLNNLGSITGGMTSTPALGTLCQVSETDNVAGAYASTYPIALVLIVIASNLMVTLL